ncbi:hypothetical protein F5Y03DRAFT_343352 [Xylaria venustula]|nr:hypothetical protein F5Y03DRAFT_343352 [Xylaria venustula]
MPQPDRIMEWEPGRISHTTSSLMGVQSNHHNLQSAGDGQIETYKRNSYDNDNNISATTISRNGGSTSKTHVSKSQHPTCLYDDDDDNYEAPSRARNGERDGREMSSAWHREPARDEIIAMQQFDAIWDPAKKRDLTVHLKMDIHEDLTDILEEFSCLHRLGDFISARQYYGEHFEDSTNDPYVLIQYGEMLLEQGDYSSLLLKLGSRSQLGGREVERNGSQFLDEYLDLMVFFAECHYIPQYSRSLNLNKGTLSLLDEIVTENKRDITSTEIRYLALLHQLCGLRHSEVTKNGLTETLSGIFPPFFHKKLYQSLLMRGRIWDFRDITVARMTVGSPWQISAAWSSDSNFRARLYDLVTQWTSSSPEQDTSTLLALLDIITSLVCWDGYSSIIPDILTVSTQIASSIVERHPEAMKSRPFIHWTLIQCELAEMGGREQLQRQEDRLATLPGILYRRTRGNLAQYAPNKTEKPGWVCRDAPSELQDSARMALRTFINLGDYRSQAKTLQLLILMSADPSNEFYELGKLQNTTQGDNYNYVETLAAGYSVSNDDLSRERLRVELASQQSIPGFSNWFSAHQLWILSKIRHALARDDTEAKRALSDADTWYNKSSPKFVKYVETKNSLQRRVHEGNDEAKAMRPSSVELKDSRSFSLSPEPRQRHKGGHYTVPAVEDLSEEGSDGEREKVPSRVANSETPIVTIEDLRNKYPRRTIINNRIPGCDPIQPSRSVRSFCGEDRTVKSSRGYSFDESDSFPRRSSNREVEHVSIRRPRQRPEMDEQDTPRNQLSRSLQPRLAEEARDGTRNDLTEFDISGKQSTRVNPPTTQPTPNRATAGEHAPLAAQGKTFATLSLIYIRNI